MFECMAIELGLDEHHRLAAEGERNAGRPQPPARPARPPRQALAAILLAVAARLDPATWPPASPTIPRPARM